MFRAYYEIFFLAGLVMMYATRRFYRLLFRSRGVKEQGIGTKTDRWMSWLAELGVAIGVIYVVSDWLAFGDYPVVHWLGWAGMPIFGYGLWILVRAHQDLDRSWSPHVKIQRDQKLITDGIYRYVRHPMYAGYVLLGIGQMLMLANWFAGPAFLILFGLLYLQRVGKEEQMMLNKFEAAYQAYMKNTGRLFPWGLFRRHKSKQSRLNPNKK